MKFSEISNIRLSSQKLVGPKLPSAKEAVEYLGAMQAQDFAMAKLAIGIRTKGCTEKTVEQTINKGDVLRSHLMRSTWHFVSSCDIHWMLGLLAPRTKALIKPRLKSLELDGPVLMRSYDVIEKSLSSNVHKTRDELDAELKKAKIKTDDNRLSHIMVCAELDKIIVSGEIRAKKQTYALLSQRVSEKGALAQDEALAILAKRYFEGRGPATVRDFAWWSGLSVTEAKQGLELVKSGLHSETIESGEYWMSISKNKNKPHENEALLLPAFDEFLISYTDRSASLTGVDKLKAVSNNGIFYPVIVVNGQVVGRWKRTFKKDTMIVETEFFKKQSNTANLLIEQEAQKVGNFLGKKAEIVIN